MVRGQVASPFGGKDRHALVASADVSAVQREYDPAPEAARGDPVVGRCHLL